MSVELCDDLIAESKSSGSDGSDQWAWKWGSAQIANAKVHPLRWVCRRSDKAKTLAVEFNHHKRLKVGENWVKIKAWRHLALKMRWLSYQK